MRDTVDNNGRATQVEIDKIGELYKLYHEVQLAQANSSLAIRVFGDGSGSIFDASTTEWPHGTIITFESISDGIVRTGEWLLTNYKPENVDKVLKQLKRSGLVSTSISMIRVAEILNLMGYREESTWVEANSGKAQYLYNEYPSH